MNKYIVQLIEATTGKRTLPLQGTIPSIVDTLYKTEELNDALVLLIGYVSNGELTVISDHLFTVPNFCEHYKGRETHFHQMDQKHETDTSA